MSNVTKNVAPSKTNPMGSDLATDLLGPTRAADRAARALPQTWARIGCPISFTILGQPPAHKNGYRIVKMGERVGIVKSKEAIDYVQTALMQIPPVFRLRLEGPVFARIVIWYASERPDLDESLVLDILQDRWAPAHGALGKRELVQAGVYRNDRQVRDKHITHGIDRRNPRAEITIQPLIAQQTPLF